MCFGACIFAKKDLVMTSSEFNAFFDDVRDPRKRRPRGYYMPMAIGPLELALIRMRFVDRPGEEIDLQIARATDAVRLWAAEGVTAAMNQFNSKQSVD